MTASQTSSQRVPRVLLCALCLCSSGCHIIFPFTVTPGSDSTTPGDGTQPVDLADMAGLLDQADMAAGDQFVMPSFTCTVPKPVNEMKDTGGDVIEATEVALRADGSALVARKKDTTDFYTALRSTSDPAKFESWSSWTLPGLAGYEDYHFYEKAGQEHALTAKKVSGKRELWDCLILGASATCDPLVKPTLTPPTLFDDFDGPALANDLAVPELVFSVNQSGAGPELIYWAVMDGSSQLKASQLPGSFLGAKDDDPAISPDGTVVIFSSARPGGLGGVDLWIVRHQPGTSTFSPPTLAPGLFNSTGNDSGPALVSVTLAGSQVLELYFSSNRSTGKMTVYRSVCTIQ